MKVAELYRQKSLVFSIEIYPPKTQESLERLKICLLYTSPSPRDS